MRVLLAVLLLAAFPPAAASSVIIEPPVECDIDDDLYQHCRVGKVYFVYSLAYGCFGVRIGSPASCDPLLERLIGPA